jgi:predicted nucleic acid-binding protein
VKYLVDANVWLDALAAGSHSEEAQELIRHAQPGLLCISDFSLHTIGLILTPRDPTAFREFLDDLIRRRVFTLHLTPADLYTVVDQMKALDLDFDDAFQHVVAERHDLQIVSFDSHFDRTPRARLTPSQALQQIRA